VFAVTLFLCSPALGRLSDRFGRRPIILLGLAGTAANYVIAAEARSLWLLFLARLVGGVCGSNAATAAAYIADVTPPAGRTAAFGQMGAVCGLGLALGPVLGGLAGNTDPRLAFWLAAGISAINLATGWLILPESLALKQRRAVELRAVNPF